VVVRRCARCAAIARLFPILADVGEGDEASAVEVFRAVRPFASARVVRGAGRRGVVEEACGLVGWRGPISCNVIEPEFS
jgi:hypothetical protein